MAIKENFISMAPDEESSAKVSLIDNNKTLMIDQYTSDVEPGNPEYRNALASLTGTGYRPNGFRSVRTSGFDDNVCMRCCTAWACCTLFSGGGCYLLPCVY